MIHIKKKKKEEEEKEINKTKKQFSGKKKKFDKILAMLTRKRERTQIKKEMTGRNNY